MDTFRQRSAPYLLLHFRVQLSENLMQQQRLRSKKKRHNGHRRADEIDGAREKVENKRKKTNKGYGMMLNR